MLKTYEIILDIEKDIYSPSNILFTVSRNDLDSVELTFFIKQDDANFDLTGTTVQLAVKKPSGLTVYQDCEIVNAVEGEAKIILSMQSYIEYGIYTAEVYVRDIDQLAVTSAFYYSSRSAIMEDETIESVNDWSALQNALLAYDLKPVVVDGFPTITPEYIGQMAFDVINNIAYVANDLTNVSWQTIGTGEGGGGNDNILGTGAPAITPVRIGQIYIDTTGGAAYIATGATAADWEQIDNEAVVGGLTDWTDILNKPIVFPADLAEPTLLNALAAKADDIDLAGKADLVHTHLWADITDKPTTFTPSSHIHVIADTTGLQTALDAKADDTDLAGKANLVHTHAIADVTNLQTTLDAKADDTDLAGKADLVHTHEITDITGLLTVLDAKADDTDLAGKANVVDVYTKADTYNKTEVYNKDEVDAKTLQGGGMVVIDNLTSTSTTDALSANQGRILDTTKADAAHTHVIGDVTGLQTALDAKADDTDLAAYLTEVQGDARYQQLGADTAPAWVDITGKPATFPPEAHQHTSADITDFGTAVAAAIPIDYLTQTEGDARYQAIGADTAIAWGDVTGTLANQTDLQTALDAKADDTDLAGKANLVHTHLWADVTDKPTTFTPSAHTHAIADVTNLQTTLDAKADDADLAGKANLVHTHAIADVTNLQTTLDAKAPIASPALTGTPTAPTPATADNTTKLATTAFVQTQGYLKTIPLASGASVGGVQVGNGLGMSGNYLYTKTGASLGIDGSSMLQVVDTAGTTLRFWRGTQTAYDAIVTKDANTLYFISG